MHATRRSWHVNCIVCRSVSGTERSLPAPVVPAWPLAGAAAVVGLLAIAAAGSGSGLVRQMALHLTVMGVAAPLAALQLRRTAIGSRLPWAATLVPATAAQIGALYLWHLPAPHAAALDSPAVSAAMHGSLGLVAVGFWLAVLARRQSVWPAVGALLVTGKLFCLLGVLLVLARRPLLHAGDAAVALAEQQLAGLLMLGACPLSYVGVAFAFTCLGIPQEPARRPPVPGTG